MKYMNQEEFDQINVFGMGTPNNAFTKYFIGRFYLNPLNESSKNNIFDANVIFEPGCRNKWHIHMASEEVGEKEYSKQR